MSTDDKPKKKKRPSEATSETAFKAQFDKLVAYANQFGYRVLDSDCDCWDFRTRTICNNSKRTPERRVVYLCHEIGHLALFHRYQNEYTTVFSGLFSKCKKSYRLSKIEEEVLAWDEGYRVASHLGIVVDLRTYSAVKKKELSTYL